VTPTTQGTGGSNGGAWFRQLRGPGRARTDDSRGVNRGRHRTPGRFRTRVITDGVTPSLHVDYKHTTIKQYHKQGRALRTP